MEPTASEPILRIPSGPALRIQAAAVAAQQAALTDEETRLLERKHALEHQKEQLAAHLEAKRRRLLSLSERTQAERRNLQQERATYEKYIDKVTGDLGQAQRELLEQQQALRAERERLNSMLGLFKKRVRRRLNVDRARLALREEELANEECNLAKERETLDKREDALVEDRLRFNADYELGRRQLYDAWQRLRRAQGKWRQRRGQERALLKLREHEVEYAEISLRAAQRACQRDQEQWQTRRQNLELDVQGLNQRCVHERRKLLEQRQQVAAPQAATDAAPPADDALAALPPPGEGEKAPGTALVVVSASTQVDPLGRRVHELDRLAADLADQRVQLADQWARLLQTQQRWQDEQAHAAAELEGLIERVGHQETQTKAREQARLGAASLLQQRHQELLQLHDQLIAWRGRLQAREHAWESERTRLLAEVKHREALAAKHLEVLAELRRRWSERRREERERLQRDCAEYDKLRHELSLLREDVERRAAGLVEEKRRLTEKSLALEQLRQELVVRTGDAAKAERRIVRLRRRWLAQNATALRAATRARDALQAELATLNSRAGELEERAAAFAQADADLAEKMAAWEHKQILANTRHARMQHELQIAQAQRTCLEHELGQAKEEIERIARTLLDEPESPMLLIERAA